MTFDEIDLLKKHHNIQELAASINPVLVDEDLTKDGNCDRLLLEFHRSDSITEGLVPAS